MMNAKCIEKVKNIYNEIKLYKLIDTANGMTYTFTPFELKQYMLNKSITVSNLKFNIKTNKIEDN